MAIRHIKYNVENKKVLAVDKDDLPAKEIPANQKRVEEGIAVEEKRKKKSLESFRCYLAYMRLYLYRCCLCLTYIVCIYLAYSLHMLLICCLYFVYIYIYIYLYFA